MPAVTAAPQLDLFARPAAAAPEEPAAPAPPDPWAWHKDHVSSSAEDGLHAWYATPRIGLWLHLEYDAEASPKWAWRVERDGRTTARGAALTKEGAQDAARAEAER